MQENDFEKQVHQKMVELRLPPSEAVWEKVEMRLHRKEKRRRWIIWFPLLAAGLFLGGYFMVNTGQSSHIKMKQAAPGRTAHEEHNMNEHNKKEHKIEEQNKGQQSKGEQNKEHRNEDEQKLSAHINEGSAKPDGHATDSKRVTTQTTEPEKIVGNDTGYSLREPKATGNEPARIIKVQADTSNSFTAKAPHFKRHLTAELNNKKMGGEKRGGFVSTTQPILSTDTKITQEFLQENIPDSATNTASPEKMNDEAAHLLEPVNIQEMSLILDSIRTSIISIKENQLIKIKSNYKQRKNWEWGLSFQGGKSSLSNATFNKIVNDRSYVASSPSFNLSANGASAGNPTYLEPYPAHASIGFSAGVFVKKNLSAIFSVSLGLHYTLYTTTTKVGNRVDSSFQSNITGFQRSIHQYFRIGSSNNYTNKYHYLEVPVTLQTKLTSNRKLPLYWDLGFSVSKLIASNALHFDNLTGLYYKDNDLLNKTQCSISTGLPLTLTSRKKFGLQAGPTLQYGLSSVLDKGLTPAKRLLFFGIKANIVLGKK